MIRTGHHDLYLFLLTSNIEVKSLCEASRFQIRSSIYETFHISLHFVKLIVKIISVHLIICNPRHLCEIEAELNP